MKSLLLIDDHEDFRAIMSTILRDAGYEVWEASCPENAFQILDHELPHLIICDLHMPFTTGADMHDFQYSYSVGVRTIEELQWAIPQVPILVTSAAVPTDIKRFTAHLPSVVSLSKPVNARTLLGTVEFLLQGADERVVH
jgi:CheY-like chemotaxis protein